jgi:hypothetical protein
MRLSIGYPDADFEKQLLNGSDIHLKLGASQPVISAERSSRFNTKYPMYTPPNPL